MTGKDLHYIRTRKFKISQEKLAQMLELSVSTIARWEQHPDDDVPNTRVVELALEAIGTKVATKK